MNYLYRYDVELVWDEEDPQPGDMAFTGIVNGKYYYLSGTERLDGALIGQWDNDGYLQASLDDTYFDILGLANNPDGTATGIKRYSSWQGHGDRLVQDPETAVGNPIYPADNQPFDIEVRHDYDDTYGWGWRAEMYWDVNNPGVHAIGIYSDPECTQYLFTTGAFTQQESTWQLNEEGNPKTVWATVCPPGQRTGEVKGDWHFAVLEGSSQKGHQTLSAPSSGSRFLFWTQGTGSQWVDSGATVTGMAGTATLVSDTTPFQVDMLTRINGVEQTITQVVSGQWIVQTPYTLHQTGATIEVWQ